MVDDLRLRRAVGSPAESAAFTSDIVGGSTCQASVWERTRVEFWATGEVLTVSFIVDIIVSEEKTASALSNVSHAFRRILI